MAVYNLPNYTNSQGFGLPLNIRRGNPNPLDNSAVWASLEAAQNYAQNDPVAYVGQILTVVSDIVIDDVTVKTATAYVIDNEAGDLKEVGSSPVGDESTIAVSEDGIVSLYGIAGLALTREEDDGSVTKINYQPLLVEGKLTWVEPSTTTVEDLDALIAGLDERVTGVEDDLAAEIERAADAEEALGDRIDDVIASLEDYAKTSDVADTLKDYATTDSVNEALEAYTTTEGLTELLDGKADKSAYDETVSTLSALKARVEAFLDETGTVEDTLDSLQELIAYINTHDDADISGILASIQAIETKLDGVDETVVKYVKAATDALNIGDYAKAADLAGLAAQFAALEELVGTESVEDQIDAKIADLNKAMHTHDNADVLKDITADQVEAWDGAEQAAKDYADDIKDELVEALNKRVIAEDGKSLISNTLIGKLEDIDAGAQVNVIDTVDTAQFGLEGKHLTLLEIAQGKVTGLPEALAGKLDKPTDGSRLITTDEATKLEKLVLGENGEVSVSGKVAAGNVEGLDAWITARAGTLKGLSENNFTDTLLGKLNAIDAEALANKIESVKVGGTLLDIVEKSVNIPVASASAFGVVKSYTGDAYNKVVVAEDGTMSVDKIDVSTIYVPAGIELVLNGGSSTNA